MTTILVGAIFPVAPAAPTVADDDAGSGTDAGGTRETALAITPGKYSGRVTPTVDAIDTYTFVVDAGQGYALSVDGHWALPLVHVADPTDTGRAMSGVIDIPGTWVLQINQQGLVPINYTFVLTVVDRPEDDDLGSGRDAGDTLATALPLGSGGTGRLDLYDSVDVYIAETEAPIAVRLVQDSSFFARFDVRYSMTDGLHRAEVSVSYGQGRGGYALEVVPAGAYRVQAPVRDLAVHAGGMWLIEGYALRHHANNGTVSSGILVAPGPLAVDREGNVYAKWKDAITRFGPDGEATPVAAAGYDTQWEFALGDGRLYLQKSGRLVEVDQSRADTEIAKLRAQALAQGPGTLLFGLASSDLVGIDVVTGDIWRHPITWAWRLAVDDAGRAYVANAYGWIFRYDHTTNTTEPLGSFGQVTAMDVFGDRLYLAIGSEVRSVPLDATGVTLPPRFDTAPISNLAITRFVGTEAGDDDLATKAIEIEVTNVGLHRVSESFGVFVAETTMLATQRVWFAATIDGLEAGESRMFTVPWDATSKPGPRDFFGGVDMLREALETSEDDNRATITVDGLVPMP